MESADLLLVAFTAIAVASAPLSYVWVRRASGGGRLRRLAWVTAFLTFDLVVFGGFTRLTDSGLGCPDWPGCYAKANPLLALDPIRAAETALPTGPVTLNKAWIEMIHRYLAMAVGLLIVTMLVVSVVQARRERRAQRPPTAYPGFAVGLLGLVVLQGAFGAWTVTQRLQPIFVATHLLLGLSLFAALVWHAKRLDGAAQASSVTSGFRALALLAAMAAILQIALGAWVSANYAVLACSDFPRCQGVWVPAMDFANGFTLWRPLGRAADGSYLSVEALTAIHWTHRTFSGVVFALAGCLAALGWRTRSLARPSRWLALVLVAQLATGIANVVLGWPLVAAVLHNAGAASLVGLLAVINYEVFARRFPVAHPSGFEAPQSPQSASRLPASRPSA
jgi:heme a synthase